MTQQDRQRIASGLAGKIVEPAGQSGMPRTMARVHVDLLLSEHGAASISAAVNFPVQEGFVGRDRDPQRRRDIYAVDDDACSPCDALTG
ncbi:hypothetical protein [Streptomyces sp. NPDC002573]|uniref:hypothetical protein n=1 Tax=Streptomyces sp. NPDC002573 TaxID=3364651 RepID=UPI0036C6AF0A